MTTPKIISVPDLCAASVVMTLERIVGETQSPFTFNTQVFKWSGERWAISFSLPNITKRADAAQWQAFGAAMEGKFNCFLYGDPLGRVPRGVATGSPVVNGNGQDGNTLLTSGWTAGVTGIMRKGDYIQLGTGLTARLHMLIEDANSDGSGNAALSIVPALRESPASGAAIVVNNAKGVFRLVTNSFSWSASPGPVYRMSFDAMEHINA